MSQQLTLYQYSILDYSRKYDVAWQKQLEKLRRMFVCTAERTPSRRSSPTPTLSRDSILLVLAYLKAPDLLSAAVVCREWRDCAESERLWESLLREDFAMATCALVRNKLAARDPALSKELRAKELYWLMEGSFRKLVQRNAGFKTRPVIPAAMLAL